MDKSCMDRLIGKLWDLLRENGSDEFDEAVTRAKDLQAAEVNRMKRENLEGLFDTQIATLKDRGTPEQIVGLLANQRVEVMLKANKMTFKDGHIPFLPVIPRTYRSPYDLMSAVRHEGKVGYTSLHPVEIIDIEKTPDGPYYIYDVEDGQATLGVSSGEAEEIFKSQKRCRHTMAEDIALATHTEVLSRHSLLSTGSRFESDNLATMPRMNIEANRPYLGWAGKHSSNPQRGSASLGSR